MSEKYIPSPEEMSDVEERMSVIEVALSKSRAEATPEQIELLKECDLFCNKDHNEITGTIKGHKVALRTFGYQPTGTIDGAKIDTDIVVRLFEKYLSIAKIQDFERSVVKGTEHYNAEAEASVVAKELLGE